MRSLETTGTNSAAGLPLMNGIDSAGFEILDETECLGLLAELRIGRVGVTLGALPAIFPIVFCLIDGTVVFFTAAGTTLLSALSETVVAFEADRTDPVTGAGWSVQVVGLARVSSSRSDRTAAESAGLRGWAGTERPSLITVRQARISGRRLPQVAARQAIDGLAPLCDP